MKKETLAQVFSCEFCEIFKNTYFYRAPLVAASEDFLEHLLKAFCLYVHFRNKIYFQFKIFGLKIRYIFH